MYIHDIKYKPKQKLTFYEILHKTMLTNTQDNVKELM